jgi:hypothetical protein
VAYAVVLANWFGLNQHKLRRGLDEKCWDLFVPYEDYLLDRDDVSNNSEGGEE